MQLGIDQPLENIATTMNLLGEPGSGDFLSNLTTAPTNYQSAVEKFMNPDKGDFNLGGFGFAYLPRAVTELAGQVAGSMASRIVGATAGAAITPGGKVTKGIGAGVGAFAGPFFLQSMQIVGPIAYERARNNGREEPTEEDIAYAFGTASASGALDAIGARYLPGGINAGGFSKRMLKAFFGEGVTEGFQSGVEQVGATIDTKKGLEVSPKEMIGEGILGGSAGGAAKATSEVAADVMPFSTQINRDTDPVKSDLANRLRQVATDLGANLRDVDRESSTGARVVADNAQRDLVSEINAMANTIKNYIDPKGKGENRRVLQLEEIIDRARAAASIERGKNKVKNVTYDRDYDRLRSLAPPEAAQEVETLVNLLKQSTELTMLQAGGMKGGFSRLTDELAPFGKSSNYLPGGFIAGAGRPLMTLGVGVAGGPLATATQLGTFGVGRLADLATGRRSPVRRFIRQYEGQPGSESLANLPSIQAKRASDQLQSEAQRRQIIDESLAQNVNPPFLIYKDFTEMGLSPAQWSKGIDILARTGKLSPEQKRVFETDPLN